MQNPNQPVYYKQPQSQPILNQPQIQSQPVYMQPQIQFPQNLGTFVCEISGDHNNIQATEKCDFCHKMMCLKCSCSNNTVTYGGYGGGYYGNYYSYMLRNKCCVNCHKILEESKKKFGWLYLFHLIMIIFGSMLLLPFLLIGCVVGLIYHFQIPNDKYNEYIRRMNLTYSVMELAILVILAVTVIICALCIIIPLAFV